MHKEQNKDKEIFQKIEYLRQLANNSKKIFQKNLSVLEDLITEISKKQDEFDNEILELITNTLAKIQTNDKSKKPLIKEILDLVTNKDDLFSILLNGLKKLRVSTTSLSFLSKNSKRPDSTNSNIIENKDDLSKFHHQQYISNELLHLHPNNPEKQKIINELLTTVQKIIIISENSLEKIKINPKKDELEISSDWKRAITNQKQTSITINEQTINDYEDLNNKIKSMLNIGKTPTTAEEEKLLRFLKSIKQVNLVQDSMLPISSYDGKSIVENTGNSLMMISDILGSNISYKINSAKHSPNIDIEFRGEVFLFPLPNQPIKILTINENLAPKEEISQSNQKLNYDLNITASYDKLSETLTLKSTILTKQEANQSKIIRYTGEIHDALLNQLQKILPR